jgi:hypothetical protein
MYAILNWGYPQQKSNMERPTHESTADNEERDDVQYEQAVMHGIKQLQYPPHHPKRQAKNRELNQEVLRRTTAKRSSMSLTNRRQAILIPFPLSPHPEPPFAGWGDFFMTLADVITMVTVASLNFCGLSCRRAVIVYGVPAMLGRGAGRLVGGRATSPRVRCSPGHRGGCCLRLWSHRRHPFPLQGRDSEVPVVAHDHVRLY